METATTVMAAVVKVALHWWCGDSGSDGGGGGVMEVTVMAVTEVARDLLITVMLAAVKVA